MIDLSQMHEVTQAIEAQLQAYPAPGRGPEAWYAMLDANGFSDADAILNFIVGYARAVIEQTADTQEMMIAKAAATMLCVGAQCGRQDR